MASRSARPRASAETRGKFRKMLRAGELEDKEVEVAVADASPVAIGAIDLPGVPPGQMANLGEMMKGMFGGRTQKRRMPVAAARRTGCASSPVGRRKSWAPRSAQS